MKREEEEKEKGELLSTNPISLENKPIKFISNKIYQSLYSTILIEFFRRLHAECEQLIHIFLQANKTANSEFLFHFSFFGFDIQTPVSSSLLTILTLLIK
jgi:hypothetical protein